MATVTQAQGRLEFCMEAFVDETGYVPATARLERDASRLPPKLEDLVERLPAGSAWRAWSQGPRGWFVQGMNSTHTESAVDQPSLELIFRDNEARPVAMGTWCRQGPARWELLRIDVI